MRKKIFNKIIPGKLKMTGFSFLMTLALLFNLYEKAEALTYQEAMASIIALQTASEPMMVVPQYNIRKWTPLEIVDDVVNYAITLYGYDNHEISSEMIYDIYEQIPNAGGCIYIGTRTITHNFYNGQSYDEVYDFPTGYSLHHSCANGPDAYTNSIDYAPPYDNNRIELKTVSYDCPTISSFFPSMTIMSPRNKDIIYFDGGITDITPDTIWTISLPEVPLLLESGSSDTITGEWDGKLNGLIEPGIYKVELKASSEQGGCVNKTSVSNAFNSPTWSDVPFITVVDDPVIRVNMTIENTDIEPTNNNNSQTTVTVTVSMDDHTDLERDFDVSLAIEMHDGVGGHNHAGPIPKGTFTPTNGKTKSTGKTGTFTSIYKPSEFAGSGTITATIEGTQETPTQDILIRVKGLVQLQDSLDFVLKQPTATHPDSYWVSFKTEKTWKLIAYTYAWLPSSQDNEILFVTEGSLPYGGRFDCCNPAGQWANSAAHKSHREGKDIDVRISNIPDVKKIVDPDNPNIKISDRDLFERIIKEAGAIQKKHGSGSTLHYHLDFLN